MNPGRYRTVWLSLLAAFATPAIGGGTSTPEPFVLLDRFDVFTTANSILSADFDNDGDTDLFVFNRFSGLGSLMINDGQAGFTEAPPTVVGQEARMTADTGDIDADGDTDMIIGDLLFINDGSGGFVRTGIGPAPITPDLVKLVDMNNDGLLDIACVDIDARLVGVYLNNGGLSFTLANSTASDGAFHVQINAADFDGDGDQDLFLLNSFTSFMILFRNNGSGNIGSSETIALPSGATAQAIADMDGVDGPDLVLALGTSSSSVALVANRGDGTFKPAVVLFPFFNAKDLKVADLDDDGDQDIVVAGPSGVRVAFNDGSGQFDTTAPTIVVNGEPTGLAVADLDGDGDPEITTVNPDDSADCTVLPFNFDVYLNRFRNKPVVAQSPAGVLATAGETAVLTVTLGLGHGPFSFQWFRDGQPIADGDGISGAATGTLSITGVQPEDVGLYELEIGNDLGFVRTPPTVLGVRPDPDACFPDVNADGLLDFFDISRFIVEFGRGCP